MQKGVAVMLKRLERKRADERAMDEWLEAWPACPRCGDLHPPTTIRCDACGARVGETLEQERARAVGVARETFARSVKW